MRIFLILFFNLAERIRAQGHISEGQSVRVDTMVHLLTRFSVTKGKSYASQASMPPSSGRTLVIPLALSSSATRALVASLGHEQ